MIGNIAITEMKRQTQPRNLAVINGFTYQRADSQVAGATASKIMTTAACLREISATYAIIAFTDRLTATSA